MMGRFVSKMAINKCKMKWGDGDGLVEPLPLPSLVQIPSLWISGYNFQAVNYFRY